MDELDHPEDVLVVLHPALHLAELDVRDDVVDAGQRGIDVGHRQRHDLDAVAVHALMRRDLAVGAERPRQHEANAALLEHVRGAVAQPRLQAGVGDLREAEGVGEVVRGLAALPTPQLHVVDAVQRHEITPPVRCGRVKRQRAHGAAP